MSDDEDAKWNADMDRLLNEVESAEDGGKWKEKRMSSGPTSKTNPKEETEGRSSLLTRKGVGGGGGTDRLFSSMFRNQSETSAGHSKATPTDLPHRGTTPAAPPAADEDWLGLSKVPEPSQPPGQNTKSAFGRRTRQEDNSSHEPFRARTESQSQAGGTRTESGLGRQGWKGRAGAPGTAEPSHLAPHRNSSSDKDILAVRELNPLGQKENEKSSFDIGALLAQQPPSRPDTHKDPRLSFLDDPGTRPHDPPLSLLLPQDKSTFPAVAAPPEEEPTQPLPEPAPTGVGGKKKVVVVRKQGADGVGGRTTLQLPAHLVDEEDLKMMSGSLKTLYAHQLSLLEGAYKDQMECQAQSACRREEMLKDELNNLRQDLEGRVERLKKELWEMEAKCRSQDSSTLVAIEEQVRELGSKMAELVLTQTEQNRKFSALEQNSERGSQDSVRSLKESMSELSARLESGLKTSLAETIQSASSRKDSAEQNKEAPRLEKLLLQLDTLLRDHYHNSETVERELAKSGRRLECEAKKLSEQEKKLRGTLQKGTSEVFDQSIKAIKLHSDKKRKEDRQMTKDFQNEVRTFLSELKSKVEGMEQTRDGRSEKDQTHLLQLMEELRDSLQAQKGMRGGDGVREAELERGQLEVERKWVAEKKAELSESKAQVERERAEVEGRKRAVEEEKQELQRFHASTQIKLEHAHQIRKEAESSQLEHSHVVAQYKVRLEEMDREMSVQKEHLETRERSIRVKEHNLERELGEIRKEKAFLDKVRGQSLCAECQKLLPPLQLSHQERSAGDGLDLAIQSSFTEETDPLQSMLHRYYAPQMFRISGQPQQSISESWS